jgi:hypothetical protein
MAPKKIRILAQIIILTEWVVVAVAAVYIYQIRHVNRSKIEAIHISKESVVFPDNLLRYYYEWKANQTIVHERRWLPHTVVAHVNASGFIGNENYLEQKPKHTYRIIALGDSFTEGPFVENEFTYPKQLETLLNTKSSCTNIDKFEVINLGVGGYDIEYSVQRFLQHGIKYEPDLIVWFLKEDDFTELAEISRSKTDEYIASMSGEIKDDISKWDHYYDIPSDIRNEDKSLWEKVYYAVRNELIREYGQKKMFDLQTQFVNRFTGTIKTKTVLSTFNFTEQKYKIRMKYWVQNSSNLFFFDGVRNIYAKDASFLPFDGHPNEKGYAMMAEDIYGYLMKNLLPCKESK